VARFLSEPHVSNLVGEERFRYASKVVKFLQILLSALLVCGPIVRAQEVSNFDRTSYCSVVREPASGNSAHLPGIAGESVARLLNRPQWKWLSWFKARIFVVNKVKLTVMTKADGGFVFSEGEGVE
jgi:hypothetical protein